MRCCLIHLPLQQSIIRFQSMHPADLQAMLEIVFSYSVQWRYQLNAQKSAIQIFGESAASRARNPPSRQWLIGSEVILEKDSYHHLGVLRSVSYSSNPRTSERCSSSRRAFFSLNTISDFSLYADECVHLPLSSFLPSRLGKPYPHWRVTLGFPMLSRKNISMMKLLLNCNGLAFGVCRFQTISSVPFVTQQLRTPPTP